MDQDTSKENTTPLSKISESKLLHPKSTSRFWVGGLARVTLERARERQRGICSLYCTRFYACARCEILETKDEVKAKKWLFQTQRTACSDKHSSPLLHSCSNLYLPIYEQLPGVRTFSLALHSIGRKFRRFLPCDGSSWSLMFLYRRIPTSTSFSISTELEGKWKASAPIVQG